MLLVCTFSQHRVFSLEQIALDFNAHVPGNPGTLQNNFLACRVQDIKRKHHVILKERYQV
jgi:hypothetical protein